MKFALARAATVLAPILAMAALGIATLNFARDVDLDPASYFHQHQVRGHFI